MRSGAAGSPASFAPCLLLSSRQQRYHRFSWIVSRVTRGLDSTPGRRLAAGWRHAMHAAWASALPSYPRRCVAFTLRCVLPAAAGAGARRTLGRLIASLRSCGWLRIISNVLSRAARGCTWVTGFTAWVHRHYLSAERSCARCLSRSLYPLCVDLDTLSFAPVLAASYCGRIRHAACYKHAAFSHCSITCLSFCHTSSLQHCVLPACFCCAFMSGHPALDGAACSPTLGKPRRTLSGRTEDAWRLTVPADACTRTTCLRASAFLAFRACSV